VKIRNIEKSERQNERGTRRADGVNRFDVSTFQRFDFSRAFSLLEILVALTLLAAITAVVAPMVSDDSRLRVMAAAQIISSDIELAQVMTIAHPETPVIVRFHADEPRYWLAYASAPNTPIAREDTGAPYDVTLGLDRASGAEGVAITLDQTPDNTIEFEAHGGLSDFTLAPTIRLVNNTRGIQLAIAASTGSITESDFTPEAK
jgi:prepilin-type N-terminal cleavage/methylation domain-containing protein